MAHSVQNKNTSFRQFEVCSLCKVNHAKRKKHVYSKHHQQILQNIIKKFSTKIQLVKQNLFCPKVQDGNYEFGAKFWCYFCKSEYLKHDLLEMTTIIGAGLLEHIASEEHKENMTQFFWDNLLDKKLKPKFILSLEDLQIAKKAAFLAVKKFQKSKDMERKQLAERIQKEEEDRQRHVPLSQSDSPTSSTQLSDLPGFRSEARTSSERKRTSWAQGPGLTSIIKDTAGKGTEADVEGNVHTGATPPWLKPDTPTSSTGEIGPTMADYQKHLERKRKAKLPSNRVGANFDHKTATSEDWLPSFGRVWSKGRRLQSRIHFEKEWKGKQPRNAPTRYTTLGSGATNMEDTQSQPASYRHDNGHTPWSSTVASPEQTGQTAPYKPKGQVASATVSELERPSIPVVPYKRRRETNSSGGTQTHLLQTPLLADRDV